MKGYQILEEALEGKEYIAGNVFTAADVATGYSAGYLVAMKFCADGKFPNIKARFGDVFLVYLSGSKLNCFSSGCWH